MKTPCVRVRFAPAPTGLMHLGNIRTALMNFLFAQQKQGVFVLRIEDTDAQRNFDPQAERIISDLAWLGLIHTEGPAKNELYGPYFQSQRSAIYEKYLKELIQKKYAYRCFCTAEELEKNRQRQVALKQPPRYDRACLRLTPEKVAQQVTAGVPFVWRALLDHAKSIDIHDLARGTVHFELRNFSDPILTRDDGSFTFLFANFVDDLDMRITHIFRGEDHLSNTATQAALFEYFDASIPIYWHMPILCNIEGKKLSKRDFGFSLGDLRDAGYLPQAIDNYLAIIGGGTFEKEIMSLEELAHTLDFTTIHATGQVKYDVEKLNWINQQWINQLSLTDLIERCMPFIVASYPQVRMVDQQQLMTMIRIIKSTMRTLQDAAHMLDFYFTPPHVSHTELQQLFDADYAAVIALLKEYHTQTDNPHFVDTLKAEAKKRNIPLKHIFAALRMALTGKTSGLSIAELIEIVGSDEATKRIAKVVA